MARLRAPLRTFRELKARRLSFEPLESRSLLAAVITVNSTADTDTRDDFLTLREAILVNNRTLAVGTLTATEQAQVVGAPTNADPDTINFNISGTGVRSITLASSLPTITDPVTINGYSQTGASPNTLAVGNDAVLLIEVNGNNFDAFVINAADTTIRGLVINRASRAIEMLNADRATIVGNFIGTDAAGATDLGNLGAVQGNSGFTATNVRIGSANPADRNLISGNGAGIYFPTLFSNAIVQGNYIGTNRNGTAALANDTIGILIQGSGGHTIGGTAAGAGNVVSGNGQWGIAIDVPGAGIVVQGNLIGTNAAGNAVIPNAQGLEVRTDGEPVLIGGTEAGAGNVIAGNNGGIRLVGDEHVVQGNFIGTDRTATLDLGGGYGLILVGSNNTVGGTVAGAANVIAFIDGGASNNVGIEVAGPGNTILSNSIFGNANGGILFFGTEPNPPVLTNVSGTTIAGTLNSTIDATFRIEFFATPNTGQTGNPARQGKTFLGFVNVTTDLAGNATFSFNPVGGVPAGQLITATATESGGGTTSEFSVPFQATTPGCSLIVNTTLDVVSGGDAVNSLREAIICANTTPGANTINVPAGTYTLTIVGQDEDAAATGDLDITDDLTLVGAGQATTIIQAGTQGPGNNGSPNGIDRVFDVLDANVEILTDVSISGVTIRHGRGSRGGGIQMNSNGTLAVSSSAIVNNAPTGQGGGLNNNLGGAVTITGSLISGNVAPNQGGGIDNRVGGSVTVTTSTVSNNQAGSRGGGINNSSNGTLIVNQSTISGNTAVGIAGGGIHNNFDGTTTITASTISGNSATGTFSAGGLHNNSRGSVTVTNSTISGNSATGDNSSGGVNNNSDGTITITNSTIANNSISGESDIAGNIYINFSGPVRLKNTIVADSSGGPNCVGNPNLPTSQGNNLDDDGSCGFATTPGDGDLSNVDPNLGPLANNGGPTQTRALLPGSPAREAGNNDVLGSPLSLTTDQRGAGFPRLLGDRVDIGAFEAAFAAVGCSLVVNTTLDVVSGGDAVNSLREAIICANTTPGPNTINVPAGTYTLTITGQDEDAAATGDLDITDDLTLVGAGQATTIIEAGTTRANGIDRVFHTLNSEGGATDVSVRGVTIRHGNAQFNGGGIFHEGTGTLGATNTVITNNQAGGIGGGGIRTVSGAVNLTDSTVSNNRTFGVGSKSGGGIHTNSGPLTILRSTISGNTADSDGGGIRSVFTDVTVTDSTISGNTSLGFDGGGILKDSGALTLTRSTISGNSAEDGGGILSFAGQVILINSVVSGNTATGLDSLGNSSNGVGGGIGARGGTLISITDSTISGNTAASSGGGINVQQSIAQTTITRSTISDNIVTGASSNAGSGAGGGLNFQGTAGTLTNVTVSGNTASTIGGGINNSQFAQSTLTILNSTITDNTANGGGGIFNDPSGTVNVQNTLIAANAIEEEGEGPDASGVFNSQGNNLIGIADGSTGFVDGVNGDLVGDGETPLNPQIGPLANNGGPTETHALLPDSPAIDAASTQNFPPTDQRGVTRPQGEAPDIGAFEAPGTTSGLAVCSVLTFNEPLEPRSARIVSDQDNSGRTVLVVTGTAGHDVIVVEPRPTNKSQIRVRLNGDLLGIFSKSAVRRIVAFGLDGHDVIVVNATLTQPATLLGGNGIDQLFGAKGSDGVDGGPDQDHLFGGSANDTICGGTGNDFLYGQAGNDFLGGDAGRDRVFGEAGNDHLQGGSGPDFLYGGLGNDRLFGQTGLDYLFGEAGNDILVGGSGDDRLFGSIGRDLLIGGDGADLLFGEAHDDILVAGSTAHDENETALAALLAEWTSRRKYNQRINLLRSGGGSNGAFVLNAATVNGDGVEDNLWGDGDLDWFLFGSEDRPRDKTGSELVN